MFGGGRRERLKRADRRSDRPFSSLARVMWLTSVAAAAAAVALYAVSGRSALGAQVPASSARAFELNLPVIFQGVYISDIAANISADGTVRLRIDRLSEVLGSRISSDLRAKLSALAPDGGLASAEQISAAGVRVIYDPAALELKIDIPVELQGAQSVQAVEPAQQRVTPESATQPEHFSGSLTMSASQAYVHGNSANSGLGPLRVLGEAAVNLFGRKGIYGIAEIVYDEAAQTRLSRGNAIVFHDDQASAIRYSFGDVSPVASGFQSSPVVGGISVQRNYSDLQPFRNIRPAGLFRFSLDRAAVVEVVVNGAPVRTIRLEAGQYDLSDFPFLSGLNSVELYTTDQFGRQLLVRFSQFFSAQLLNPGISEFGYSLGFPQFRNRQGTLSYNTDRPTVSAYFRRGFSQELTAGINFEGDRSRFTAGAEGSWAAPIGTFSIIAALSHDEQRSWGRQMLLAYEASFSRFGPVENPQVNLEYRYTSRDYASLATDRFENPFRHELRGRASGRLPGDFILGLSAVRQTRRFRLPAETRYAVSLGRRIAFANVTASFERARSLVRGTDNRFLLIIGVPLGGRQNVRSVYDSNNNGLQIEYSRFQVEEVGDYGIRAAFGRDRDRLTGAGEFSYNANRFAAAVRHDLVRDLEGRRTSQQTSYSFASQLAFAGDRLGFGRPVGRSFALVSTHDTLDGRGAELRQGLGREKPQARSGAFGPALAPVGNPYAPQILSVSVEDLPPGYDIGPGQYQLFPGAASGYLVQVGSDASRVVLGTLLDPDGKPAALLGGTVSSLDDESFKPISVFTNRSGRFVAEGLAPGRYQILLGGEDGVKFSFTVARETEGLVNIGTVTTQRK